MARRPTRRCASSAPSAPITPRIIQGTWTDERLVGSPTFIAHCEQLTSAFVRARPRLRKQPIAALWTVVEDRSSILDRLHVRRDAVVSLLIELGTKADRWVRSPLDWRPDPASRGRQQVTGLIRHLFELYPTPRFFESTWWSATRVVWRDWIGFDWYLHVAAGGNIRTAPRLPTQLSRRAAHELMSVPEWICARAALRWAQLRAVGASYALCAELKRTAVFTDFEHDALWLPLFAKLAAEPAFPLAQLGPLVDYIRHARFAADGGARFSIAGRSIPSLLRAMEHWHDQLGHVRQRDFGGLTHVQAQPIWAPMSGAGPMIEVRDDASWSIEEISSYQALAEEGRRMRHCVVIYHHRCVAGDTSIWSLRVASAAGEHRRITIRIAVGDRCVVEARSFANGRISHAEHQFIVRWASRNHIRVDPRL